MDKNNSVQKYVLWVVAIGLTVGAPLVLLVPGAFPIRMLQAVTLCVVGIGLVHGVDSA